MTEIATAAESRLPQKVPRPALDFPAHPDRAAALAEAHARPPIPLPVPSRVHLLALSLSGRETPETLFHAIFDEPRQGDQRHAVRHRGVLTIKWEHHTEFASLLVSSPAGSDKGEQFLSGVAANLPDRVQLLVALRMDLVEKPSSPPPGYDIGGILRSGIQVTSSYRAGEDGFIDFHVASKDVGPDQLGRRLQRVLEAEVYRTMTLIGLPLARRVSAILNDFETRLEEVTEALRYAQESDSAILERIQTLSAETEALRTETRFRFSASRAYSALVDERLDSLAEEKVGERPTLSGFTRTRLAPSVRTIESAEQRQEELSTAVSRALNLLRARVDVSLNRANQSILSSMNERQHRQLILSEAVESLSVIAISYYFLGILYYPLTGLEEAGRLPVSSTAALGILAPFVAVGAYTTFKVLRHRWSRKE